MENPEKSEQQPTDEDIGSIPDSEVIRQKSANITKNAFKLKKDDNGLILTVHHTIQENGKLLRIRLVVACFNERCTELLAIDNRGNIFIFDFSTNKYWKLLEKIAKACVARNIPQRPNEYIIGTKNGGIVCLDIEKSHIVNSIQHSSERISNITIPGIPLTPVLALIHCGDEAVLVNLDTFTASHRLDFNKTKISLKFVSYLPHSDSIFTCFTNDSVHIWSGITLNTVRVLNPIRMRDRHLKFKENLDVLTKIKINLNDDQTSDSDEFNLNCQIKDFSSGLINSFAFSADGTLICLTTLDNFIVFMSTANFEIHRLVKLEDATLRACVFLSKQNYLLIFGLTTHGQLILLDCQSNDLKMIIQTEGAVRLNISADGKLLSVISATGEANIWKTCKLFNVLKSTKNCVDVLKDAFKQKKRVGIGSNLCINEDVKKMLDRQRLIPILREFGCYPEKYRGLIWCSLLDLPCNRNQFHELIKMGIHPTAADYGNKINLKSSSAKRNLVKILSCLAHWTKVFAYSDFLPHFIFPFVKIYPKNLLIAFEIIATILTNHCQLWFEFHPMPPVNYLGICENVLNYFDSDLGKFYVLKNVTPKQYAWSLLVNGFSEVLDEQQWLCLWDNILSSPSYFLLFCVIAYNIVQRQVIVRLPDDVAIAQFFHEQNSIDVPKFIAKAYSLMEKCPEAMHPRRYMKDFVKIPHNVYPKFTNYPQKCLQHQEKEMDAIGRERRLIDERIRQLEREEMKMTERLERGLQQEEHTKRMKEMQKLYHDALKREEERVAYQRKMLLLYQKEIRNKKGKVLELVQESVRRRNTNLQENELDGLMQDMERERIRNESDMTLAEDHIRELEHQLLAEQYNEDAAGSVADYQPLADKYRDEITKLCNEKSKLRNDLKKISTELTRTTSSANNLDEIENLLDTMQREFTCLSSRE